MFRHSLFQHPPHPSPPPPPPPSLLLPHQYPFPSLFVSFFLVCFFLNLVGG
jgi:hypothetical protein